ncbi:MAG: HD-GYP domain-containing protein [Chloroflexota bacterium]
MKRAQPAFLTTWASHSLEERALAYQRIRLVGSAAILIALVLIQLIKPTQASVISITITAADIGILLWQRRMIMLGQSRIATWVSLVTAAFIGAMGMHLGGGFVTLSLGIFLILILTTALVFQNRKAARIMAVICSVLFALVAALEVTNLLPARNATFAPIYNFSQEGRILTANFVVGLILISLTTLASGEAAEILGKWSLALTREVEAKTRQLTQTLTEMELTYNNIVTALANVIEVRDYYTSDHSNRIAVLAVETARRLGYEESQLEQVSLAASMHDIGKIGIPDSILNKPGPLDEEEREIMMRHPEIGEKIIRTVQNLGDVAGVIRSHQEKFDGTGYPDGLRGEEIPLTARIIAVVDAYIAITDERVYKAAQSPEEAARELARCSGSQFDPRVVQAFLGVLAGKSHHTHPQDKHP